MPTPLPIAFGSRTTSIPRRRNYGSPSGRGLVSSHPDPSLPDVDRGHRRCRQCVQPAPRVWSCPWSIKLTVPLISYRRLTGSEFLSGSRNLAALVRQTLLFHVLFDGSQQRDGTCPIFRIADLKMRIEERHH